MCNTMIRISTYKKQELIAYINDTLRSIATFLFKAVTITQITIYISLKTLNTISSRIKIALTK